MPTPLLPPLLPEQSQSIPNSPLKPFTSSVTSSRLYDPEVYSGANSCAPTPTSSRKRHTVSVPRRLDMSELQGSTTSFNSSIPLAEPVPVTTAPAAMPPQVAAPASWQAQSAVPWFTPGFWPVPFVSPPGASTPEQTAKIEQLQAQVEALQQQLAALTERPQQKPSPAVQCAATNTSFMVPTSCTTSASAPMPHEAMPDETVVNVSIPHKVSTSPHSTKATQSTMRMLGVGQSATPTPAGTRASSHHQSPVSLRPETSGLNYLQQHESLLDVPSANISIRFDTHNLSHLIYLNAELMLHLARPTFHSLIAMRLKI